MKTNTLLKIDTPILIGLVIISLCVLMAGCSLFEDISEGGFVGGTSATPGAGSIDGAGGIDDSNVSTDSNNPVEPLFPNDVVLIIPDGFVEEEYTITRRILGNAGILTHVAGQSDVVVGEEGLEVVSDVRVGEFGAGDFKGFVIIGGSGVPELADESMVLLAKEADQLNKPIAALCFGPIVLLKAGVLADRQATVCEEGKSMFDEGGVLYVDQPVVQDGNVITSGLPEVSEGLVREFMRMVE